MNSRWRVEPPVEVGNIPRTVFAVENRTTVSEPRRLKGKSLMAVRPMGNAGNGAFLMQRGPWRRGSMTAPSRGLSIKRVPFLFSRLSLLAVTAVGKNQKLNNCLRAAAPKGKIPHGGPAYGYRWKRPCLPYAKGTQRPEDCPGRQGAFLSRERPFCFPGCRCWQ